MNRYVLIISAMLNGHGVTEVWTQPDQQTCEFKRFEANKQILSKGVSPLDIYCQNIVPMTVPPPPVTVQEPIDVPVKKAVMVKRTKKIQVRSARVLHLKQCVYRKYRVINHRHVWYCKKRK